MRGFVAYQPDLSQTIIPNKGNNDEQSLWGAPPTRLMRVAALRMRICCYLSYFSYGGCFSYSGDWE